jgi:hypothetical protein
VESVAFLADSPVVCLFPEFQLVYVPTFNSAADQLRQSLERISFDVQKEICYRCIYDFLSFL